MQFSGVELSTVEPFFRPVRLIQSKPFLTFFPTFPIEAEFPTERKNVGWQRFSKNLPEDRSISLAHEPGIMGSTRTLFQLLSM